MKNIFKLLAAILVSELAGVVGSIFTTKEIPTWYQGLVKPALNPPSWVFGPVWITLYALMGVAAFLVWQKGWSRKEVRGALAVFGLQLGLNTLWSIVFFGAHAPGAALFIIGLLWLAIVGTMVRFFRLSKPAAYLLVPYLLWVSFASYLNLMIWKLN